MQLNQLFENVVLQDIDKKVYSVNNKSTMLSILQKSYEKILRGIFDNSDNTLYLWDAEYYIHDDVCNELGLDYNDVYKFYVKLNKISMFDVYDVNYALKFAKFDKIIKVFNNYTINYGNPYENIKIGENNLLEYKTILNKRDDDVDVVIVNKSNDILTLLEKSKLGELRGIVTKDSDCYVWDSFRFIHYAIASKLGLEWYNCYKFYVKPSRLIMENVYEDEALEFAKLPIIQNVFSGYTLAYGNRDLDRSLTISSNLLEDQIKEYKVIIPSNNVYENVYSVSLKSDIYKLLNSSKFTELRAVIYENRCYCWDSFKYYHQQVCDMLGLPYDKCYRFYIEPDKIKFMVENTPKQLEEFVKLDIVQKLFNSYKLEYKFVKDSKVITKDMVISSNTLNEATVKYNDGQYKIFAVYKPDDISMIANNSAYGCVRALLFYNVMFAWNADSMTHVKAAEMLGIPIRNCINFYITKNKEVDFCDADNINKVLEILIDPKVKTVFKGYKVQYYDYIIGQDTLTEAKIVCKFHGEPILQVYNSNDVKSLYERYKQLRILVHKNNMYAWDSDVCVHSYITDLLDLYYDDCIKLYMYDPNELYDSTECDNDELQQQYIQSVVNNSIINKVFKGYSYKFYKNNEPVESIIIGQPNLNEAKIACKFRDKPILQVYSNNDVEILYENSKYKQIRILVSYNKMYAWDADLCAHNYVTELLGLNYEDCIKLYMYKPDELYDESEFNDESLQQEHIQSVVNNSIINKIFKGYFYKIYNYGEPFEDIIIGKNYLTETKVEYKNHGSWNEYVIYSVSNDNDVNKLLEKSSEHELRGLLCNSKIYLWKAYDCTHDEAIAVLGLTDEFESGDITQFYVYPKSVKICFHSKNKNWAENSTDVITQFCDNSKVNKVFPGFDVSEVDL